MAQAIQRLYPHAHFAYGPATDNGFYYDVDLGDDKLTDEDLQAIEQEMRKIVKENLPIKPYILPRDEAIKLMEERGEIYKVEHIGDLAEDAIFWLEHYQLPEVKMLGDIVISVDHALHQADLYGHGLEREVAFLTVHSMLHLLGYDHVNGGLEQAIMREKEETILDELGLAITKV